MDRQHKLGWGLAALLVAGNMIGSGIYLLPVALAPFGSSSLIAWVLVALGALALAAVFGGLSRIHPGADGLSGYIEKGLGRFAGYVAIIAYWLANVAGIVGIAVAAVGYLAVFFPDLRETWPGAWANVALIWIMTLLAMFGPRLMAQLGGLALLIGLVPIAAAIGPGLFAFDPAVFAASWNPSGQPLLSSLPASLVLIFWAFLGVECAGVISKQLRDPTRDVGRASLAGVGLAAVVYIGAVVAVFGIIPASELAVSTSPFADLAGRLVGPTALVIIAACAVVKASGTVGGWITINAETARSAARKGYLPRVFGTGLISPRTNFIIHGVLMSLIALATAQPTLGGQFAILVTVTTVLVLVVYILCCAALIVLTRSVGLRIAALVGMIVPAWATATTESWMLLVAVGLVAVIGLGWPLVRHRVDPDALPL